MWLFRVTILFKLTINVGPSGSMLLTTWTSYGPIIFQLLANQTGFNALHNTDYTCEMKI